MECSDIMECLEKLSNKEFACDWDNVGLLVGHRHQSVRKIMISLDPSEQTVKEAVKQSVDMLVTHHPMIFHSIKQVTDRDPVGSKVLHLAENHIAYYAMHTNFDVMGGMAELAAERINLQNTTPLEITYEEDGQVEGIGRIGELAKPMTIYECAAFVKEKFQIPKVMVYGNLDKKVKRVAISPGSGKSMISSAYMKGAQLLITGDIGHHEGLDAKELGVSVIDASHHGLEHIFIDFIYKYLKKHLKEDIELVKYDPGCPFMVV